MYSSLQLGRVIRLPHVLNALVRIWLGILRPFSHKPYFSWFTFLFFNAEQIGQEMLENLSHDREKIQRARERVSLIISNCWFCILFALGKFFVHAKIIQMRYNHHLQWRWASSCQVSLTGSHTVVTKSKTKKLEANFLSLSQIGHHSVLWRVCWTVNSSDFLGFLWNSSVS